MWSLKDDEYRTSYDDQPMDEHEIQQKEAPEEEEGGDEQQEEDKEATAQGSQAFERETVCWGLLLNTLQFLMIWIGCISSNCGSNPAKAVQIVLS